MSITPIENFSESLWFSEHERFKSDKSYAEQKTLKELSSLVARVIGEKYVDSFVFKIEDVSKDGKDGFKVFSDGGKVYISGRNGVSLASGVNFYLKNFAHVSYNPLFVSNLKMPDSLPATDGEIIKKTPYDTRYALNYCTYGYTMAFWSWKEYEELLDWFAMNGVNLMLDIVGQEEVQRRFLNELGYTDEEVKSYLPGPAYFPWFYMQNMSSFGGPLPDNWFGERVELARKMHDRMEAFGIAPVLQGYSGMVPPDFKEKHPDADVIPQGKWCGFTRPSMLMTYETKSSDGKCYFDEIADIFYKKQIEVFGNISNFYSVDPFHEGGKMGGMEPALVYNVIQKRMLKNNPDAVWLIQQWQGQITDEKLSNLYDAGKILILDLQSDKRSYCEMTERRKTPWIWCMLHNFGGRMGVDGDVVTLANDIPQKLKESNYMTGIGITPEALENSPVVYDMLFDMAWESEPIDCESYIKSYIRARYGSENENLAKAWDVLLHTAYDKKTVYTQGAGESVINARPCEKFTSASTWGHSIFEYDLAEFEKSLKYMLAAYDDYCGFDTYIYDVVDIAKQILSTSAIKYHKLMINAYKAKDITSFKEISDKFLDMIRLEDDILSCSERFSARRWIDKARNMLDDITDETKDLFEFNARALISTWGDYENCEGCLSDYSNRQWAGLTREYYLPRWENFVKRYTESLENNAPVKEFGYFAMEWEWANRKTADNEAKSEPKRDLKVLAETVLEKYSVTDTTYDDLKSAFDEKNAVNLTLAADISGNVKSAEGNSYYALIDGKLDTTWRAAESVWPVEIVVNLNASCDIHRIDLSMPQVAGDFPLTLAVSALCGGKWENIPCPELKLIGTVSVDCDCTASAVKLIFTPKNGESGIVAEFAEIAVY